METIRNVRDCIKATAKAAATNPPRTLRVLSSISGILLIMGGIAGVFTINPLSMVISIYNIFFGVLIVLTELKSWPIIRTFQKRVDVYFHLLSVPRGKGGFYCFIGFLAFFSSDWSLARVCVLIVSIVGLLHLLASMRCGADEAAPNDFETGGVATHSQQQMSLAQPSADSSSLSWQGMMKQVISDSPEVLSAGLSAGISSFGAASTSNSTSTAGGGIGASESGGTAGGSGGSGLAKPAVSADGLPVSTLHG